VFRISSNIPAVASGVQLLYGDYPLLPDEAFVDFDMRMERGIGLHRWVHPQVRFVCDGGSPFKPLPISHAYPLLEWAMNWCISTQAHQYLMLHAAVIERDGLAAILPAPPGSGKSTLCAALIHRGWRLLSDEMTLISPLDGEIVPLCRPVSLKNESLEIIRNFAPSAVFSDVVHDTSKGSVGLMKVEKHHLDRMNSTARPGWVIFPKYVADASAKLTPRSRADSMLELGRNAFNYGLLGASGFNALAEVVDHSDCYDFEYSALDDAVHIFDSLATCRRS
jgi:HprK-related kinase A